MSPEPPTGEVLAGLQRQRRMVVNAFLWVILAVGVFTFALNAALLGPAIFTVRALFPNVVLIATVLVSLWLNRRGYVLAATLLTTGLLMLAASLPVLLIGLGGNGVVLLLFFLPLVMAGLLLGRLALATIAGLSILVVLVGAVTHGGPVTQDEATLVGNELNLALQFGLVFATVTFLLDRFGFRYQSELGSLLGKRIQAEHELRKEKEFSDAVIKSVPGLFYVRDIAGAFVRWNAEFQEVTGYSDAEIRALPPMAIFEEGDHAELAGRSTKVLERGHDSHVSRVRAKDGSTAPYFLSGTRAALGGEDHIVSVGIDRTEIDSAHARIEELNEELAKRLDRLVALREIDRAIIGSLDLDLTLGVVLDQVRGRLGVPGARILLYDQFDKALRFGASQGLGGHKPRSLRLRLGEGPAGRAALERQNVSLAGPGVVADLAAAEDEVGDGAAFHGYVAVPLVAKGRLQGVLELFSHVHLPEDEQWHDFLDALSVQAAIALDSASLFEGLERSNVELRQAYDTTIEGWGSALDLKDEETEGHSRRVTDLSVQLAARLGLTGDVLVNVRRGALLHDIGKMGVPDRVLLKPGKLDADEWEIMKQHTTFAHQLLSSIPFLRMALDIPYAHHERWDGGGYPLGLKGEQIPLTARLFAVVDVYDALTSDRPYRPAWTEESALAHIRAESGSHFDPRVVEEFMEMVAEKQTASH